MEYNTIPKIQYSKHNSQYIHSQHKTIQQIKNTIQYKAQARLNALAVVRTQPAICTAQCAGSSTNKMRDLQHITHEDTMHYLHTTHTAQQNR